PAPRGKGSRRSSDLSPFRRTSRGAGANRPTSRTPGLTSRGHLPRGGAYPIFSLASEIGAPRFGYAGGGVRDALVVRISVGGPGVGGRAAGLRGQGGAAFPAGCRAVVRRGRGRGRRRSDLRRRAGARRRRWLRPGGHPGV